jgi:mRNA interferase MazF
VFARHWEVLGQPSPAPTGFCPITRTIKGYPFEVILPDGLPVPGAVLADRVKGIDRHARRIGFAGKVPDSVVQDVQARIGPSLGLG